MICFPCGIRTIIEPLPISAFADEILLLGTEGVGNGEFSFEDISVTGKEGSKVLTAATSLDVDVGVGVGTGVVDTGAGFGAGTGAGAGSGVSCVAGNGDGAGEGAGESTAACIHTQYGFVDQPHAASSIPPISHANR